jgi:hypothetical protein
MFAVREVAVILRQGACEGVLRPSGRTAAQSLGTSSSAALTPTRKPRASRAFTCYSGSLNKYRSNPSAQGPTQFSIKATPAAQGSKGKARAVDPLSTDPATALGRVPLRDEDIVARKVRLVRPIPEGALPEAESSAVASSHQKSSAGSSEGSSSAEDGEAAAPETKKASGLTEPESPRSILRRMDRSRFWLQQVAVPGGAAEGEEAWPIVKIVSKKEAFDKAKRKSSSSKSDVPATASTKSSAPATSAASAGADSPALKQKDLQLSWSVSPHDLSHKIARAAQDCQTKGNRLRVTIVARKGQGKAFWDKGAEVKHAELLKKVDEEMMAGNESEQGWEIERMGEVKWKGKTVATVEYMPVGKKRG